MPRSAIETGCVDRVLPLQQVAPAIVELATAHRVRTTAVQATCPGWPDPFHLDAGPRFPDEESASMLRTILVGLDGSEHADSALTLAIRWARRFNALLVGMGCVDEPGVYGPEEYLVGHAVFEGVNASLVAEASARVEGALLRATVRCAEAGVTFRPLKDVGMPHARIVDQAQRCDLIALGRQTHFRFGWQDEPDETLRRVVSFSPRPVVAVPDETHDGATVVVAYDGSPQAARALASFEASGLGRGCRIQVVSVAEQRHDATRHADLAVEFLRSHDLDAVPNPVASGRPPAEILQEVMRPWGPRLVVMGAYGQPVLREYFLGSTTRTMLEQCPCPLFLDH
jgi:nucleotide-binding universal stress UspA family protein